MITFSKVVIILGKSILVRVEPTASERAGHDGTHKSQIKLAGDLRKTKRE